MSDEQEFVPGRRAPAEAVQRSWERLVVIIARLRGPDGCPWDRVQTLASIKPYTLEETYELLEAIDQGDDAAILEELGDVLLQVVLDCQIAADSGRFDIVAVVDRLADKLVARHPHVFGDAEAQSAADVVKHWDRIKQQEKQRTSIFEGLPIALPALARAARIAEKAARVGYDFPVREMLFDKLREELQELADELFPNGELPTIAAGVEAPVQPDVPLTDPAQRERVQSEIGDLLFVVANIARRWQINPEEALRGSNRKFERRVRAIEDELKRQGKTWATSTLAEMEAFYQSVKQRESQS